MIEAKSSLDRRILEIKCDIRKHSEETGRTYVNLRLQTYA